MQVKCLCNFIIDIIITAIIFYDPLNRRSKLFAANKTQTMKTFREGKPFLLVGYQNVTFLLTVAAVNLQQYRSISQAKYLNN